MPAASGFDVVRVIAILEEGGAQLSALRLTRELRRHGVRTRLLAGEATPGGLELAQRYGVPTQVYGAERGLQWLPSPGFARWLADRLAGADLVHAHMFGAWWAVAQVLRPGVPLAASEHNPMTWPLGDFTAAAKEAAPRLDAFFVHGPGSRAFAEQIGIPADRRHEGRSIIDAFAGRPLPGLPRPRVTFVGRVCADKGTDVLVDALAGWADAPVAYLVGTGPQLEPLRRRIDAAGLADRIRTPGWSDDAAGYVAGAAAHVVPSRLEEYPQSALMGLGLGVPVVGSTAGGLPQMLGEGRGILVPPEDPAALAAALARVLAEGHDPEPGRRYVTGHAPAAVAELYLHVYASLLAAPAEDHPGPA